MKKQLVEKFFNLSIDSPFQQIQAETDSKKIRPGMIFFALEGKKTDGHLYINEAIANGASLIVVNEKKTLSSIHVPTVAVADPLETLQALAKFHVCSMDCKIVGITGSYGKSTTKEFISQLLEADYKVGKTQGNRNSQVGLALSLIDFEGDEEILVLEMGMSEPGNIKKLINMAAPHISVLTGIGNSHIGNLGSIEMIAEEKSEILDHRNVELAFIEKNSFLFPSVVKKNQSKNVIYSLDDFVKDHVLRFEDLVIDLNLLEFTHDHFIQNLIPAIGIAKFFKVQNEQIVKKIQTLESLDHRFKLIKNKKCLIIDDAYNSSLESLGAAVDSIQKRQISGKKIAVIGAILEQGDFSHAHHLQLGKILEGKFEKIYFIGDPVIPAVNYLQEKGYQVHFLKTKNEIACLVKEEIQEEDLLFIKGSNGYRLWEIIDLI